MRGSAAVVGALIAVLGLGACADGAPEVAPTSAPGTSGTVSATPAAESPTGVTPGPTTSGAPTSGAATSGAATSGAAAAPGATPSASVERQMSIVSPADGAELTSPVVVEVEVRGFELVELTGQMADDTGHLYAFVDESPPAQRVMLPESESIVKSADTSIELGDLPAGRHTVTVVVTHAYPVPFEPRLQDSVTFTVTD